MNKQNQNVRLGLSVIWLILTVLLTSNYLKGQDTKPFLFWTDIINNTISRSDIDGGNRTVIVDSPNGNIGGIALDLSDSPNKVYFVSGSKIKRFKLDGSELEDVVVLEEGVPFDLELDTENGQIYWSDINKNIIFRGDLINGKISAVDTLLSGINGLWYIDLDLVNRKLYWVERGARRIMANSLDQVPFQDIETVVGSSLITNQTEIDGLSVDPNGNQVFWSDGFTNSIYRKPLFSSDIDTLNFEIPVDTFFFDISYDNLNSKLYWSQSSTIVSGDLSGNTVRNIENVITGKREARNFIIAPPINAIYWGTSGSDVIGRADLKGVNINVDTLSESNLIEPRGVAVDTINDKIYWTERQGFRIRSANMDGSNLQTLIEGRSSAGIPTNLVLDLEREKIYWIDTDENPSRIKAADLSGANVRTLARLNVINPSGITLDPTKNLLYWATAFSKSGRRGFIINKLDLTNPSSQPDMRLEFDSGGPISDLILTSNHDSLYLSIRQSIETVSTDSNSLRRTVIDNIRPMGLTFNKTTNDLIWTDRSGKIQKVNLDVFKNDGIVTTKDITTLHSQFLGVPVNLATGSFSSLLSDSIYLRIIYDNLNEEAQDKLNWGINPISSWNGILIDKNRVTGLNLNNLGITVSISSALGSLTALSEFTCSSNQIKGIPNLPQNLSVLRCNNNRLTSLPGLPASLRELECQNNFLVFEDLVPVIEKGSLTTFNYIPQKEFGTALNYAYEGLRFELGLYPKEFSLSSNKYEWRKKNSDRAVDPVIGDQKKLLFENVTLEDEGTYTLTIRNEIATDLILKGDILLRVVEDSTKLPIDTETIIVKNGDDLTLEELTKQNNKLKELGYQVERECWCNDKGIPRLQLFLGPGKSLIDLDMVKTEKKSEVGADSILFSYKLIHEPITDVINRRNVCKVPQGGFSIIDSSVVVALIDSGADPNHNLLKDHFWMNPNPGNLAQCIMNDLIGYDFRNDTSTIKDFDGHGTHGMGIMTINIPEEIGASLNVMNLKVFEKGKGLSFDMICALHYAIDNGAELINLSLGYYAPDPSPIFQEALLRAKKNDILVIASAGNDGIDLDTLENNRWPSDFKDPVRFSGENRINNLVVVAALNETLDSLAKFSNYGRFVDVAAPGTGIFSVLPNKEEGVRNGTSMAANFVSRLAMLVKAVSPESKKDVETIIGNMSRFIEPLEDSGQKNLVWGGRLDETKILERFNVDTTLACETLIPPNENTLTVKPHFFGHQIKVKLENKDNSNNGPISIRISKVPFDLPLEPVFIRTFTSSNNRATLRKKDFDKGLYLLEVRFQDEPESTSVNAFIKR